MLLVEVFAMFTGFGFGSRLAIGLATRLANASESRLISSYWITKEGFVEPVLQLDCGLTAAAFVGEVEAESRTNIILNF